MNLNGNKVVLAIFLLLINCTPEKIDVNEFDFSSSGTSGIKLVVEGGIFPVRGKQYVRLTSPGTWPEKDNDTISHATVSVTDDTGEYFYQYIDSLGLYESLDNFKGQVGKTYTLNILYKDKIYTASDSMIACNIPFLLPIAGIREENNLYAIEMYMHNFGYEHPVKILWNRMGDYQEPSDYSYHFTNLGLFHFANGDNAVKCHVGNPVHGIFRSEKFLLSLWAPITDTATFYFLSLSSGYYDFLIDFYEETNWSTGLFSTIPGNIRTNLSKGGSGYFFTCDVKTKSYEMIKLINENGGK